MHPIESGIRTNLIQEDRSREASIERAIRKHMLRLPKERSWLHSASRFLRIERPAHHDPVRNS